MEYVDVWQDEQKEWRWRHIAENGQIVATCAEGYRKRSHAHRMAKKLHPGLPIVLRAPLSKPKPCERLQENEE